MTNEEAELYADKMTYENAIYNVMQGYGIPYKKATKNKLTRLVNEPKNVRDKLEHKTCRVNESNFSIHQYRADMDCSYDCGYNEAKQEDRSKIEKAIVEIEEERHIHYTNVSDVIDSVLEILKRNLGE